MYSNDKILNVGFSDTFVKKKYLIRACIICTLATFFYLYEFILQVSPAVMTNELMRDLHLNAAGLGTLAACYYYSYTPMQLPAGLLFDRFGPRRLITFAVLVCAVGALLFGSTHNVCTASLGRFFMGIGSAFSFIGALLLISRWFPAHYFALLAGLVQLMSSVGAIAGQVTLESAIKNWGWRSTTVNLFFLGALLALLIWTIVRDGPETVAQHQKFQPAKTNELQRLKQVCSNQQTWIIALYTFTLWAPITAFAALWGIPFLVENYGITTEAASKASAMIWLGIGIGSPLLGWFSDKIKSRAVPLSLSALLGFISLSIVIYGPQLHTLWLYITLFIFGLGSSGQSLSFGVVQDINHPDVAGTAIGFNNMATVAGGALFQPLIGVLLFHYWNGIMQNGSPHYGAADYQKVLIMLPLCYVVALITSRFFIRETHCKKKYFNESPTSH